MGIFSQSETNHDFVLAEPNGARLIHGYLSKIISSFIISAQQSGVSDVEIDLIPQFYIH